MRQNFNIVVPMAGRGSRLRPHTLTIPKPLIPVAGKPIVQRLVEDIVKVCGKEVDEIAFIIGDFGKEVEVEVDGVTEGAACTALLAKEFIDNGNPLFFANSDQFVEWDSNEFFYKMNENDCDGGIPVFHSTHPKWSFAKLDEDGFVTEVQEKNPISDLATIGFYYYKHGSDFVKYAEQMIEENSRTNGEFYVAPVYNWAIKDGKKIGIYMVDEIYELGTPEYLENYLSDK